MKKITLPKYNATSIVDILPKIDSVDELSGNASYCKTYEHRLSGGIMKVINLHNLEILFINNVSFPETYEIKLLASNNKASKVLDFTILLNDCTNWVIADGQNIVEISEGAFFTSSISSQTIAIAPQQPLSFVTFYIDLNTYHAFFENGQIRKNKGFIHAFKCLPPDFNSTLDLLLDELNKDNFATLKLSSLVWSQLHIFFAYKKRIQSTSEYQPLWHKLDMARKFIEKHFSEEISLQRLSKEANTNETSLKNGFKHFFQLSPHQYQIAFRLAESQKLLINTHLQIGEISYMIGYENTSYFIKVFKKEYNCTPTQFRVVHRHL